MAVTRLGPGGYPRPPYGSFSGKPAGGGGGSKTFTQMFTVLGPGGYSKPPYASFAGKPGTIVVSGNPNSPKFMHVNVGSLMCR